MRYGHLTWEWTAGLRSILHPLIYAIPYFILNIFNLDYIFLIKYAPKFIQALFSAISDFYVFKISSKLFGHKIAKFSHNLILHLK